MTPPPQLSGWFPVRIDWRGAWPAVEWAYLGDRRFTAPFFDQTVGECLRHPFNQVFRHKTPVEALAAWAEASPGLRPSGFIFHMSRCGSTLIAQMLATLSRAVVISEAEPIDSALRAPGLDDDQRIALVQGVVSALGQRRGGDESHLFIKLDSWSIHSLPLIERAFPGVPWVFAYREPVEVLVSQLRQRAAYMVPGLLGYGLVDVQALVEAQSRPEEHCARVLGSICEAAVEPLRRGAGLALNYRQLPDAVWTTLPGLFGLSLTEPERERMQAVAKFDAKTPMLTFEGDTASKVREATDLVRQMADRWIRPHYDEIEAIRLASAPAGPDDATPPRPRTQAVYR